MFDCCTNSFQLKCCGNLGDPCATCKTCYNALEDLVNHLLKVAGGVGLFFSFTLVSFLCTNMHSLPFWGTGRCSRFQVTGMVIRGQKTTPKTIPGPNINPQKMPYRTYVHSHSYGHYYESSDCFEYPEKSLLKSSNPRKYLPLNFPTPPPPQKKSQN